MWNLAIIRDVPCDYSPCSLIWAHACKLRFSCGTSRLFARFPVMAAALHAYYTVHRTVRLLYLGMEPLEPLFSWRFGQYAIYGDLRSKVKGQRSYGTVHRTVYGTGLCHIWEVPMPYMGIWGQRWDLRQNHPRANYFNYWRVLNARLYVGNSA